MLTYGEIVDLHIGLQWGEIEAVRPGPGKFEGCEDARIAEALYVLDTDEFKGLGEGEGWQGRIGRFIVSEDSQGFFEYECYLDEESAQRAFEGEVY